MSVSAEMIELSSDKSSPASVAPTPAIQASLTSGDQITIIEARSGWQLINFRELWRFRELLGFLIWRDVKVRYKQTLLGAAWALVAVSAPCAASLRQAKSWLGWMPLRRATKLTVTPGS